MIQMKRVWALGLAILVLFVMIPAAGESAEKSPEEEVPALAVANPTPMQGRFFTDLFGDATSDVDVRDLLHAYNLICWDAERGMFTVDPSAVSGVAAFATEEGDHTYLLALYHDLYYSDGTRITAWDYAFSFLLSMAPEMEAIGASVRRPGWIVGYDAYAGGQGPLSGVRVLGPNLMSVTLSHEYLPFFYELGLLSCLPAPVHVIAPGVAVKDDGQGVYLANEDGSVDPVFTAELLEKTILDSDSGYMSHPAVVSGPYILRSWDGTTAEFEINSYYKGNSLGQVPRIPRLTYTAAALDTAADQLVSGELGLLNKITRADVIENLSGRLQEAKLASVSYPRVGLSFISFCCENETVSSPAVRRAIACCFDRDAALAEYAGTYGTRVDGYYGVGQWMVALASGAVEPPVAKPSENPDVEASAADEAALSAWEELSLDGLDPYALDTARAVRLLEEDGWVLNADGIREKDGTKLILRLLYPEGNSIGAVLRSHLAAHLETVGIRLDLESVPMNTLLDQWYAREPRSADMIYLASDFDLLFDPAAHFTDGADGEKIWTYTQGADDGLYRLAEDMIRTEPGNVLEYMRKWIKFQEYFNATLPMLPFYSNQYYDFYTANLRDYPVSERTTWSQAIIGADLK